MSTDNRNTITLNQQSLFGFFASKNDEQITPVVNGSEKYIQSQDTTYKPGIVNQTAHLIEINEEDSDNVIDLSSNMPSQSGHDNYSPEENDPILEDEDEDVQDKSYESKRYKSSPD